MAKTAQANEPSMEEILASIRRIISDEETTAAKPAASAEVSPIRRTPAEMAFDRQWEAEAEAADLEDVASPGATVTSIMRGDDPHASDDGDEEEAEEAETAIAPRVAMPVEPPRIVPSMVQEEAPPSAVATTAPQPMPAPDPRLLSPSNDAIVSDAFNRLANTMLASQSRTLEDIVQDLMRPMLRAWLDDNLPTMVERLVREEIERVSRGPRR